MNMVTEQKISETCDKVSQISYGKEITLSQIYERNQFPMPKKAPLIFKLKHHPCTIALVVGISLECTLRPEIETFLIPIERKRPRGKLETSPWSLYYIR